MHRRAGRAARGGARRRRVASPTIGWPIALRCTRIWCVRPVAIATLQQRHALEVLGPGRRASRRCARAAPASTSSAGRFGSRPIGASMPLAGLDHAPDERDVLLLDLAVVELPRQLLVRRSFLATTIRPDVPRSSRCTMPGPQLAADAAQVRRRGGAARSRACRCCGPPPGARPCPPACRARRGRRPRRRCASGSVFGAGGRRRRRRAASTAKRLPARAPAVLGAQPLATGP